LPHPMTARRGQRPAQYGSRNRPSTGWGGADACGRSTMAGNFKPASLTITPSSAAYWQAAPSVSQLTPCKVWCRLWHHCAVMIIEKEIDFTQLIFKKKNDFNIPSRATGLLSLTYRPDHRFRLGMKVNDRLMQH